MAQGVRRVGGADPRVTQILALLAELAQDRVAAPASPSPSSGELDPCLVAATSFATELTASHIARDDAEARLQNLLSVVLGMAALDFSLKANQAGAGDVFDALAAGLNMLGEELQATTVAKSYLRGILDSMADALFVFGLDARIVSVNRASCTLLAATESELSGLHVKEILADGNSLPGAHLERALQGGRISNLDRTLRATDGRSIPVTINGEIMRAPDGSVAGVVVVARDMRQIRALVEQADAARKQSEIALEDLREAQAQLVQSGKLAVVGELAGGVAHEINNPMTAVLGLSDLCIEQLEGPEFGGSGGAVVLREQLMMIREGARRCRTIVQNLLAFSQRSSTLFERLEVGQVLAKTLDLLGAQLRRAQVTVMLPTTDVVAEVVGNANQLQQVFTNLIMNASHAMPSGGELTIAVEHEGEDSMRVAFSDTGAGIRPDVLPRIFEPFFTTRPVGKGTGLGLSLAWGIVQSHGGRIEVDSVVGSGSTFSVVLPRAAPLAPSQPQSGTLARAK